VKGRTHLVLVACHAVYLGSGGADPGADANWCLAPFQHGEPPFYLEHIRAGIEETAADPQAAIVFSGGATRREAGLRTEAAGYLAAAACHDWWAHHDVRARAGLEEYARDSFENLLFTLCRFRQIEGSYPARVTVVSWAFKAARFDVHRDAIAFPAARFRFVGVNDPPALDAARRGEAAAIAAFTADRYGAGPTLDAKRRARNPFDRHPPYAESCPEVAGLLAHRGPDRFGGPCPWNQADRVGEDFMR
jgi:hypothetical protein